MAAVEEGEYESSTGAFSSGGCGPGSSHALSLCLGANSLGMRLGLKSHLVGTGLGRRFSPFSPSIKTIDGPCLCGEACAWGGRGNHMHSQVTGRGSSRWGRLCCGWEPRPRVVWPLRRLACCVTRV